MSAATASASSAPRSNHSRVRRLIARYPRSCIIALSMPLTKGLRGKSNMSDERRHEAPDKTACGKDLGNFTGFAHSRITAHFHAALTGYSTATYDPIAAFLPNRLFVWIPQVAKYWFHKKHAFRDYTTHGKGTGIYPIDDRVKI